MALSVHKDSSKLLDSSKYVRYTPEQVEALERVYTDCPETELDVSSAAYKGMPDPVDYRAEADQGLVSESKMPREAKEGSFSPPDGKQEADCHEQAADGRKRPSAEAGLAAGVREWLYEASDT